MKVYDALGRLYSTTNPYRPGNSTWGTAYYSTYQYDALNRPLSVTTPDNAAITTSYSGNQTTVTDQASKKRTTVTDGLGRLTGVVEDPNSTSYTGLNYTTIYGYDPLGDLTCVNQGGSAAIGGVCSSSGSHPRSFVYDAMKRLTTATNPETGTITYAYDAVGNILKKTDARPVTTCYGNSVNGSTCSNDGYDALNRPTVKSYSDGTTPQVRYAYGDALPSGSTAVSNGFGRLTQTANSVSITNILGYDALGRVTASSQTTQGSTSPYTFSSYGYNLAGALTSETLPSGRTITTTYDTANRPATLQGTLGAASPTNYVGTATAPIQYTPHGATWSFSRASGVTHTEDYNSRLQLVQSYESLQNTNDPAHMLLVSCPQWGFGAVSTQPNVICPASPTAADNGNLLGYIEKLGTPGAASYVTITQPSITYDGVNRLTGITETNNWSRSFAYDQWGNMSISGVTGITQLDVNAPVAATPSSIYNANNRRTDAGQGYDLAGNLNAMNLYAAGSIQYDAETAS
jgi:YD repeat-containing protein